MPWLFALLELCLLIDSILLQFEAGIVDHRVDASSHDTNDTVILSCTVTCSAWNVVASSTAVDSDQKNCAQVFFEPNFQGTYVSLNDQEQLSDLEQVEEYFDKTKQHQKRSAGLIEPQVNNNTGLASSAFSFRIQDGCELKVSSLPYLKGSIHEFVGNVEEIPSDWLVPKSVGCQCPQECQCDDIQLRHNECGRAYIKDDCTSCKFTYTSLKMSIQSDDKDLNQESFPEIWSSEVTSIILREGCNVTLQFSGSASHSSQSSIFIEDQITKNINASGDLTHYVCQCTRDSLASNNMEEPNEIYPVPVKVPKTKGAINTLFSSRRNLQSHPGLMAALQSIRRRRNARNAYILLLGMSGSGKSSAVNLLFDHPNITKVGDYISTTKDILQFSIPVPVLSLGLNNTALHVIDTPGIGDTQGVAEDARFLATLDEFLSNHQDLRRNLPNVILIFSKFSDNRFDGEGSPFVKMLRTLDLFKDKLVDKRSTNIVFVLTHFMSETKTLTRDPSKRIAAVRRVIQEYCTLPRPIYIVVAENKPEESFLLNINGFYQLPNGEYYPKNLFDQMQRSMVSSEDPLGEAIIQTAFSNSDKIKIISGKRYPLLSKTHEKVTQYLGILGALNKPVADTPLSQELTKAYSKVSPDLRANYPDELSILQRHLYARKLWEVENIPKTSTDIMKLLEDIQINALTLSILQTALNVTVPDFPVASVVGSGFSVREGRALHTSLFDNEVTFVETKDIIFTVPEMYQVKLDNGIDNHFDVFTNEKDLYAGRLKTLGFTPEMESQLGSGNRISEENMPASFNLVSLQEGSSSWNSLTATVNYHTYQVSVSDHARLSQEFTNSVDTLKPLNLSDPQNVHTWQNFFNKYGTHVVTGAFAGGAINIKASVEAPHSDTMSNVEKLAILTDNLANITEQMGNELIGKDGVYHPPMGIKYEFFQRGGNLIHYWSNFSTLDETHNVEAWRDSLKYEPVVLMNRLKVTPVSQIVRSFRSSSVAGDEKLERWIEEAAFHLLNASLVYLPVERMKSSNPRSREQSQMQTGGYQEMQQFSSMFRAISESSQAAQANMIQFMKVAEERRARQDRQYQERKQFLAIEQDKKNRFLQQEARDQQELQLKREQLEMQRDAQERLLRLQQEENRRQLELQQSAYMEEIRQRNEKMVLDFIIAENHRRDEIIRNSRGA